MTTPSYLLTSRPEDLVVWDYPDCPDCGANVWQLGPIGGRAVNIRCTNCHSAFNAMIGLSLIQRIPPNQEPRK